MEFTLDSIKDIKLFQPKRGYRFSVDALLLEDFISAKQLNTGIELGAGSGIISILLAKRLKTTKIIAGNIIELSTKTNLTQESVLKINKVDLSLVPYDNALVLGDKEAKHKVEELIESS